MTIPVTCERVFADIIYLICNRIKSEVVDGKPLLILNKEENPEWPISHLKLQNGQGADVHERGTCDIEGIAGGI